MFQACVIAILRFAELPPASDLDRFPSVAWCQEAEATAKRFHEVFMGNRLFEPHRAAHWNAAIQHQNDVLALYALVRQAHGDGRRVFRPSLKLLKETLGADDYALGRLPPPVPVWALRQID